MLLPLVWRTEIWRVFFSFVPQFQELLGLMNKYGNFQTCEIWKQVSLKMCLIPWDKKSNDLHRGLEIILDLGIYWICLLHIIPSKLFCSSLPLALVRAKETWRKKWILFTGAEKSILIKSSLFCFNHKLVNTVFKTQTLIRNLRNWKMRKK